MADLEVLTIFRRVNNEDAALFKLAVDGHDITKVITASHRIKGSCSSVGAMPMAAVCDRLERASRDNDWKEIEANLGAFQHELERINSYCEEVICTPPI